MKEQIENLFKNIDFKALFHHYISLAKGNISLMETGKKFTYKTAFYCIRGLLSADLATRRIIPELLIDDLFNQFDTENEVLKIAKESLERKKQKAEKEEVLNSEQSRILSAISEYAKQLESKVLESDNNRRKLEDVLTKYSINLKTEIYGQ